MPTYQRPRSINEAFCVNETNSLTKHTPEFIMSGKQILAIVLAIVVGYVAIKLLFMVLGLAWTLLSWAIYAVLVGGAIYLLYKFIFNKMLSSGKRLT